MTRRLLAAVMAASLLTACASSPEPTATVDEPVTPVTATTNAPQRSVGEETTSTSTTTAPATLRTGAERMAAEDFVAWNGLRVGLIVHTNSTVDGRHLADLVAESGNVELGALFGPEHGVRGNAGAGEAVADDIDRTGVPIHSLYGETRSPTPEMLDQLDLLVYDLQDVGVRWFTYISTLGLAMQAAAANDVPFVVLERPNPLGRTASAGAVRDPDVESFIAPYPIADAYGLTSAELAQAIVGEGWVDGVEELDLRIVAMEGWDPTDRWPDLDRAWVAPSPSLTTVDAALLYPATVLFEATTLSLGRGTDDPFTRFGAPNMDAGAIAAELSARNLPGVTFRAIEFTAPVDPHGGETVQAVQIDIVDHRAVDPAPLGIHLLDAVLRIEGTVVLDRPDFLDLLAGGPDLRTALLDNTDALTIIAEREIEGREFATAMRPYLLH